MYDQEAMMEEALATFNTLRLQIDSLRLKLAETNALLDKASYAESISGDKIDALEKKCAKLTDERDRAIEKRKEAQDDLAEARSRSKPETAREEAKESAALKAEFARLSAQLTKLLAAEKKEQPAIDKNSIEVVLPPIPPLDVVRDPTGRIQRIVPRNGEASATPATSVHVNARLFGDSSPSVACTASISIPWRCSWRGCRCGWRRSPPIAR